MKKFNILILALIVSVTLFAVPTLTSVTPNHYVRGAMGLHLIIKGHGFSTTAGSYSVAFIPPSGSFSTPINGTQVTFVDSTTLTVVIDIPAATDTGWYQLDVNDGVNFPVLNNALHVLLRAPAGINDASVTSFLAYPNPAHAALTIVSEQPVSEIALISINGQTVLKQTANSTREILNVQGLAPGMYMLNVYDRSGATSYRKIVIE